MKAILRIRIRRTSATLVGVVLLMGCGGRHDSRPPTSPASGRVTLGGEAVDRALVVFYPDMPNTAAAQATTDADGRFRLTTYRADDGAVPGKYTILVTKQLAENEMTPEESRAYYARTGAPPPLPRYRDLLPKKYNSHESSDLAAEVRMGKKNHFDLELRPGT